MTNNARDVIITATLELAEDVRKGSRTPDAARIELDRYSAQARAAKMPNDDWQRFNGFLNATRALINSVQLHDQDLKSKAFDGGLAALKRQASKL